METTPLSAFKITGTRIDGFVGEGITDVAIPDGITEIGSAAFASHKCPVSKNIKSVYIPDSVTLIGNYAFASEGLEIIRLPSNLQVLEEGTFMLSRNLNSVCWPKKLRVIETAVFSGTKLHKEIIPAGVTTIGYGAFLQCLELSSLTISENVRSIGENAFQYCKKLTIYTTAGSHAEKYAKEHGIPVKIITRAAMAEELASANKNYSEYPKGAKKPAGQQDQIDIIRNDDDFAKVSVKVRAMLKESGASSERIDEIKALIKKMEEYASATAGRTNESDADADSSSRTVETHKQEPKKKGGFFSLLKSTKKKQEAPAAPPVLNIDNDYFLIKDGRLLEWRGESNDVFVPRGVRIIGDGQNAISKRKIQRIEIPNSVWRIDDLALPFVETLNYEGPEYSLQYDKNLNFYTGWSTEYSSSSPTQYQVNKVEFWFNSEFAQARVDKHFKEHPEQLLPRSSVKKDFKNNDYVFDSNFLRNYTGTDRILTIPDGTFLIGNNDGVFSTNIHCFEAVYIPKSVKRIKDATLTFVEEVYYEGSQSEWNDIEIEWGNFKTGYTPDYYKDYYKDNPYLRDSKVDKVAFIYNVSRAAWDKSAEAKRKRQQQTSTPAVSEKITTLAKHASAFASLCYKLSSQSNARFPIIFEIRNNNYGGYDIYGVHTVHNNDMLEYAHKCAVEGNRSSAKFAYERLIEDHKLTTDELRSFQDLSDFIDFLRGGIEGYNSCKRSSHDIEITQIIWSVSANEKDQILPAIENACEKSIPTRITKKHWDWKTLQIDF